MPEDTPVDLPLENLPKELRFEFGPIGTVLIGSLASYGAVCLSKDVTRKAKQIRTNWKIKQAEKKAVAASNPPTA